MCHSLLQRTCRLVLLSGLLVTSVIASTVDASSQSDHDHPVGALSSAAPEPAADPSARSGTAAGRSAG